MADRKKVIKGLEMCLASIDEAECPEECPYYETCRNYENRVIFQPVMRDTLELLKEQEAVKPRECQYPHGTYACGFCDYIPIGNKDGYRANYCPECGKAVKWE